MRPFRRWTWAAELGRAHGCSPLMRSCFAVRDAGSTPELCDAALAREAGAAQPETAQPPHLILLQEVQRS